MMEARQIGRKVGLAVAGAAMVFGVAAAQVEAEAEAARTAGLVVYNGGTKALDAQWSIGGIATELADELHPDEASDLTMVEILRGRLEVRIADAGRERLIRRVVRLRDGHAYCIFVGQARVTVRDVTRQLLRDPSPEKVCKQLAAGR